MATTCVDFLGFRVLLSVDVIGLKIVLLVVDFIGFRVLLFVDFKGLSVFGPE